MLILGGMGKIGRHLVRSGVIFLSEATEDEAGAGG